GAPRLTGRVRRSATEPRRAEAFRGRGRPWSGDGSAVPGLRSGRSARRGLSPSPDDAIPQGEIALERACYRGAGVAVYQVPRAQLTGVRGRAWLYFGGAGTRCERRW